MVATSRPATSVNLQESWTVKSVAIQVKTPLEDDVVVICGIATSVRECLAMELT